MVTPPRRRTCLAFPQPQPILQHFYAMRTHSLRAQIKQAIVNDNILEESI